MVQIEVTRDLLVEDAVFILQCLRQNQRGGRRNGLADVRQTLANSVTLDLADYVAFLRRFKYVDVDAGASALLVTEQGDEAAIGKADVARDVGQHFAPMLAKGLVELDDVEGASELEALLRSAGLATPVHEDSAPPVQKEAAQELLHVAAPRLARVEGELGQGVVGRVRVARLGELGLQVAVKEIKPLDKVLPWLTADELARRVRREALVQAELAHPCVLPILDVSSDAQASQIVMPLAAGSLRTRLAQGPIPLGQALRTAAQVSFALACAHAKGVTHGALKPENVLHDRRDNALVSDFGMGRLVALPEGSVRVVVDLGDAAYRSPEASATSPAEPSQDAYALGAILYEMLAGKAPGREAPVPSLCRAECPRELDDLVESLLDDGAGRRPPLVQVAARLEALAGSHPLFSV
jgi:hypothetical protein